MTSQKSSPKIVAGRLNFSRIPETMDMPYLLETQKSSYSEFLQYDIIPDLREDKGLQEVFRSVFPITTHGNASSLEFIDYSFGTPKYNVRECIDRGMTYAAPLKVRLQLIIREEDPETGKKSVKEAKEQECYFGEIPLMTDQGTFIINGAERVIVSQLHRSPGISFSTAVHPNGKTTYSARIIPYRGAWVEFEIDVYGIMYVIIDRKKKILAPTFLRAFGYENDEQLTEEFFKIEKLTLDDFAHGETPVKNLEKFLGEEFIENITTPDDPERIIIKRGAKVTKKAIELLKDNNVKQVSLTVAEGYEDILGRILARDVVDKNTGEIIGECFERITTSFLRRCSISKIKKIDVLARTHEEGDVIFNTLEKDKVKSFNEALVEFFKKMRPGNPASVTTGKRLIEDMFFNERRYDLGLVGRHKINKRFSRDENDTTRTLTNKDIVEVMKHLAKLQREQAEIDDIDHLGNRRVRSVGELLQNQIRIGLAEMEKTARERMAIVDLETLLPQNLINAKPVVTAIKDFFGRSQLSQFMDQTNPLAELTHKRRLSALGPGGLSRDRAGFEVRDVHHTHYGRICPIETPEGPNIGLISSLSTYARINKYGFIETPYRKVKSSTVINEIEYLTADVEDEFKIAQANAPIDEKGKFVHDSVLTRFKADYPKIKPQDVQYMDVSPKQLVSVSASLIPFLEHDDANRALMGSNMQRQAVPLLFTESPVVGTGIERKVAIDSGVCVLAKTDGVVSFVSSDTVKIKNANGNIDMYVLQKYKRSNQNTCMNQRPIVNVGDKIKKGDPIADGSATDKGELALGRNVLVAFMPWGGYNFEDAILLSERLMKDDVFTSVHIEEFEVDARDTKLGKEEITRDIPNVSEDMLSKLDEEGLIKVGSYVKQGDILVGKVTPKGESELTSEEKLLRAIFGEKASDVRDASLRVPPGVEGVVIDVKIYARKKTGAKSDKDDKVRIQNLETEKEQRLVEIWEDFDKNILQILSDYKKEIVNYDTGEVELKVGGKITPKVLACIRHSLKTGMLPVEGRWGNDIKRIFQKTTTLVNEIEDTTKNNIDRIKTGDELPPGVIKLVKVYIATKRKISVGDKMAGRHGNKGVVAKILQVEDMPYLSDGTPVDIVLNPLGVPSRMNVGQILETHLGWAAQLLGYKVATPVFDGATEDQISEMLQKASLPSDGQTVLYDGLTGESFDRKVTVGIIYMMKLAHLVDDKMHARSIGPYSLVTQQPLGGKAQFGGQRFGEMEVWALEAYGSAYTLQELLTVKSDDVTGRTKIYESIVKGQNSLAPGIPESFNVLVKELQSLALNMELLVEEEIKTDEKPELIEEDDIDLGEDEDDDSDDEGASSDKENEEF